MQPRSTEHTVKEPLTTSQLYHTEMFTPAADHIIQLQKSTQKRHNGVLRWKISHWNYLKSSKAKRYGTSFVG